MKNLKLAKKFILTASMALMAFLATGCENSTINIEIDGTIPAALFSAEKVTEIVTVTETITEIVTVPIEVTVPTEAPTEKATESPTLAPTESSTLTPTEDSTLAPAEETTFAPTEEATEKVTVAERDIPILPSYGRVIQDTPAIVVDERGEKIPIKLNYDNKVRVIALYKGFYTINWYENLTAQVPMRAIKLFDEFYRPNYNVGIWVGDFYEENASNYPIYGKIKKDTTGCFGNNTKIDLYKNYKLEIIGKQSPSKYIVTWFDTTMVVPSNDVDLFDPDYVPDYGKKSHWIGFLDPK